MTPPADAPALNDRPRSNYPLGGTKTGPAWRYAWECLREAYTVPGEFVPSSEIASRVAERTDASPDTVKNLLLSAYRFGVLVKSYRMVNSRTQACYRISDEWLKRNA